MESDLLSLIANHWEMIFLYALKPLSELNKTVKKLEIEISVLKALYEQERKSL